MDGGSIHPHGKLDKVNIERRGDHRCGVVAAEYLWAASFSLQHSHRQAVGSRIRSQELSLLYESTPLGFPLCSNQLRSDLTLPCASAIQESPAP